MSSELDRFALGFDGRRHAVLPLDLVRIQHQLVVSRVVEHRHLLRPDDDEPLLLIGCSQLTKMCA